MKNIKICLRLMSFSKDTVLYPMTNQVSELLRGLSYVEVEVTGPNRDFIWFI